MKQQNQISRVRGESFKGPHLISQIPLTSFLRLLLWLSRKALNKYGLMGREGEKDSEIITENIHKSNKNILTEMPGAV